jgi:predicted nuclease of predicted toxin-antitoxin system
LARLYSDENFPFAAVEVLRNFGHDVLTTLEAGQAGQAIPDEDVLQFATRDKRSVLTMNRRDFIKLHTKHPEHEGIIVCKFDTDYQALAKRIHAELQTLTILTNHLIRVNRSS